MLISTPSSNQISQTLIPSFNAHLQAVNTGNQMGIAPGDTLLFNCVTFQSNISMNNSIFRINETGSYLVGFNVIFLSDPPDFPLVNPIASFGILRNSSILISTGNTTDPASIGIGSSTQANIISLRSGDEILLANLSTYTLQTTNIGGTSASISIIRIG